MVFCKWFQVFVKHRKDIHHFGTVVWDVKHKMPYVAHYAFLNKSLNRRTKRTQRVVEIILHEKSGNPNDWENLLLNELLRNYKPIPKLHSMAQLYFELSFTEKANRTDVGLQETIRNWKKFLNELKIFSQRKPKVHISLLCVYRGTSCHLKLCLLLVPIKD